MNKLVKGVSVIRITVPEISSVGASPDFREDISGAGDFWGLGLYLQRIAGQLYIRFYSLIENTPKDKWHNLQLKVIPGEAIVVATSWDMDTGRIMLVKRRTPTGYVFQRDVFDAPYTQKGTHDNVIRDLHYGYALNGGEKLFKAKYAIKRLYESGEYYTENQLKALVHSLDNAQVDDLSKCQAEKELLAKQAVSLSNEVSALTIDKERLGVALSNEKDRYSEVVKTNAMLNRQLNACSSRNQKAEAKIADLEKRLKAKPPKWQWLKKLLGG